MDLEKGESLDVRRRLNMGSVAFLKIVRIIIRDKMIN
jgi:hypothetical protein